MPTPPQIPNARPAGLGSLLFGLCLFLLAGCSWRDDLDGERRVPEGASAQQGAPTTVAPPHDSGAVAIDLFASRPLISGHRNGALVIEAGSPDFVKYIDGGVRNDWHRGLSIAPTGGVGEAEVASVVRGLAAEVYFPLDDDPGGIGRTGGRLSIRFRAKSAVKNQLVSVFLNERKLTDLRMPTAEWQTYAVTAGEGTWLAGENKLRFYFRTAGEFAGVSSAAAFSRFVIGASMGDEPAFSVGTGPVGGEQGLVVNAATRLSYYLQVPDISCTLEARVTSESAASVRIRGSREPASAELWSGPSGDLSVDLKAYRGEVVRLDLVATGPAVWVRPRVQFREAAGGVVDAVLPKADRIIFWTVSSFRADRLRARASRGFQRFLEDAFVVSELQATVPAAGGANASMMLGRFQTRGRIEDSQQTLAEKLQEHGFATALISGNGFVSDAAGFAQGYGHYDNPMRRQHHFGAKTLWRQAKKFLVAHKGERSFVHIATVEGHVPYRPGSDALEKHWQLPQPFSPSKSLDLAAQIDSGRRQATDNERAYIRALYDASIREASSAFATMLEELEDLHLPGNTVVVLIGEHGEEMWERGRFGHGNSLFQEALVTPLAIRGQGLRGLVAPARASGIDVAPTVLHLAGIKPGSSMQGQSLLQASNQRGERPLFSGLNDGSRALRLGRYKLVNSTQGALALYDLKRDTGEQSNLALQEPIAARALRTTLSVFVAFEDQWSTARWGQATSPLEAFARDLGF